MPFSDWVGKARERKTGFRGHVHTLIHFQRNIFWFTSYSVQYIAKAKERLVGRPFKGSGSATWACHLYVHTSSGEMNWHKKTQEEGTYVQQDKTEAWWLPCMWGPLSSCRRHRCIGPSCECTPHGQREVDIVIALVWVMNEWKKKEVGSSHLLLCRRWATTGSVAAACLAALSRSLYLI